MGVSLLEALGAGIDAALGPTAIVYALAALGLNVHYGYAGLLNFGQAGFMLVGAYGLAVSVTLWGLPLWAGLSVAALASVGLALLLGVTALRLRPVHLAVATLAGAEAIRLAVHALTIPRFTDGSSAAPGPVDGSAVHRAFEATNPLPPGDYRLGMVELPHTRLWVIVVGWSLVAACLLLVRGLAHSPWGRALRAIRDDEVAAQALGKAVVARRMQALTLGGVLGGLAGVVLALSEPAVAPGQFLPQVTLYAWAALLLGGSAATLGPLIGSVLLWLLLGTAGSLLGQAGLPLGAASDAVEVALAGIVILAVTMLRPRGLVGSAREVPDG